MFGRLSSCRLRPAVDGRLRLLQIRFLGDATAGSAGSFRDRLGKECTSDSGVSVARPVRVAVHMPGDETPEGEANRYCAEPRRDRSLGKDKLPTGCQPARDEAVVEDRGDC